MACQMFGLECKVYMVKVSYQQKPYRRIMMETWGAQVVASPSTDTAVGQEDPRAGPGLARQPRHRHLRGGRGRRHARRHQVLARQRAQPRADAPDRHRLGGPEAAREGRRLAGRRDRLRRRRLQLRRAGLPLHRRQADRQEQEVRVIAVEPTRLPQPDQGQVRLRLRRHRRPDAAGEDAHARPHVHARAASTPAGCATTAWRRWSASSTTRA